jgi:hypothetical protein
LITWNCEWFFLFFVFLVIVWFFLTGNGDTMKKIGGVESNFDWVVRVLLEICVELWGFREVWWIMWKSWLNQLDWTCDDYFEMRYGRGILSLRVFKYLISWLCDFNFFGVLRANRIVTAVMTQLAMEFWPFMVNRTLLFFEFNLGFVSLKIADS